jgi:toxin ParE1/3/4
MFKLAKKAIKDLDEIWDYSVDLWGQKKTEKYVAGLDECFFNLSKNQNLGRLISNLSQDVRIYRHERHYVFYVKRNYGVRIMAVLHEKMDFVNRIPWRI